MIKCRNGFAVFWTFFALTKIVLAQSIPMHSEACDKNGCYSQEAIGGWGLKPQRTYSLKYNGSDVCPSIIDALNHFINGHEKHKDKLDASNPVFEDQIFVKWEFISGNPVPGSLPWYLTDYVNFRWTIVPYLNDDHPYLFSNVGNLWNVPQNQLRQDWSNSDIWKKYSIATSEPTNTSEQPKGWNTLLQWQGLGTGQGSDHESILPKLSKINNVYPSPWDHFDRKNTGLEFAKINNRYYTLLVDPSDMIVVDDMSLPLGDDLCYIQSTISNSIKYVR